VFIIQSTKNIEFVRPKDNHDVWRIKAKVKVPWPPVLENVKGITDKDKAVLSPRV
jgi:hypothetical protein